MKIRLATTQSGQTYRITRSRDFGDRRYHMLKRGHEYKGWYYEGELQGAIELQELKDAPLEFWTTAEALKEQLPVEFTKDGKAVVILNKTRLKSWASGLPESRFPVIRV